MPSFVVKWKFRGITEASRTIRVPCTALVYDVRQLIKRAAGVGSTPMLDVVLYTAEAPVRVLSDFETCDENSCVLVQRLRSEEASKLIEDANEGYHARMHGRDSKDGVKTLKGKVEAKVGSMHAAAINVAGSSGRTICETDYGNGISDYDCAAQHLQGDASFEQNALRGVPESVSAASTTRVQDASPPESLNGAADIETEAPARSDVEEEEENRRIDAIISQHAEHRGPSEYSRGRDLLSQRYYRNRNLKWTPQCNETTSDPTSNIHIPNLSNHNVARKRLRNTVHGHPSSFGPTRPLGHMPVQLSVSADYICHMCGEKGHHIKNCPKSQCNRFLKKIKPATGIPANFLKKISPDDIALHKEVYLLKDGQFAVMKDVESVSARAYFSKTVDQRVQQRLGKSADANAADPYKCPICSSLFTIPLVTPCCAEAYCRDCIWHYLSTTPKGSTERSRCPGCGASISFEDLILNKAVQDGVAAAVSRSGASATTAEDSDKGSERAFPEALFKVKSSSWENSQSRNRGRPIKRVKAEVDNLSCEAGGNKAD